MTFVDLTGYHLSFDAEMSSSADLWLFSNTFYNGDVTIAGNSEAETYVPAASNSSIYSFSNGALTINATPNVSGGYRSGLLSTASSFSQNQGYFEVSAKVAPGAGFWSAFWLLAADYSAEVDIVEQPNNDGAQNYFTSIKTAQLNAGSFENGGGDLSTAYHTYGFMWTASTVQFSFDGNYVGYAAPTPAAMATTKLFILANLAVGGYGSWPGQPASGATSGFSIDYIRAYSNDPNIPTSAPTTNIGTDPSPSPSSGPSATTVVQPAASAIVAVPVSTPVYRFFDSLTGTQFLTSSASERDTVLSTRPDLIDEGIGFNTDAAGAADPNATPIYRFFDAVYGTHFYTASDAEKQTLTNTRPDLIFEEVGFYGTATPQATSAPVYRFFETTNGTHFYTSSEAERGSILATRPDLIGEGIAFYAAVRG